jgi:type I site-specific restriction endonuclease
MTATPLRQDNRDTYRYFGNPLYTYSLRQGIDDGFLAPYRVHRIISTVDAAGWRPSKGELDRFDRRFARYADDCNVYVHSLRAGKRVMESLKRFIRGDSSSR